MTIGSSIKKLRTSQGLTQDQLAERLYVTRQTMSNWERGTSQPNLEQLEAIAGALDVEVMELLYGPAPKEGPSRKRLIAGGICLVAAVIQWVVGNFYLGPQIEHWVQRHYQMGQAYFYVLVYEGLMILLFVLGALLIASALWNLTLKKTGRVICLVIGLVVGLVWLFSWGSVLAMVFTEWQVPNHEFFLYQVQVQFAPWGKAMEGIAILFLFLALNPPRKKMTA